MIQNLNFYSIALLDLSLFIHPNWLIYAPFAIDILGNRIGKDEKFVLINTTNIK